MTLAPRAATSLDIVILGLAITSSWGNGHATTYRGLLRGLAERGHRVTFLERNLPWYADNRDLPKPPYGKTYVYSSLAQLKRRFATLIGRADAVLVGSFVPEGKEVGTWVTQVARGVTAFYDIDTPVTVAKLTRDDAEYISRALVPHYDLYLSFTGGPLLERLEREFGARAARPLYCSVDTAIYAPARHRLHWDLGYMGTYSDDRQPALERLLCEPARRWQQGRFKVVGPQYPRSLRWPGNVRRIQHLAPDRHRTFYAGQRFTLNITRAAMVSAGWSPSVRLFEAAACATPVISDAWPGLEAFFVPGKEILLARNAAESLAYLRDLPETERRRIGDAARARVLASHTAAHRAAELEAYLLDARQGGAVPSAGAVVSLRVPHASSTVTAGMPARAALGASRPR